MNSTSETFNKISSSTLDMLNNAIQAIKDSKAPLNDAIQSLFTQPLKWLEVLYQSLYVKNKETTQETFLKLQEVVTTFFDKNSINISSLLTVVVSFIVFALVILFLGKLILPDIEKLTASIKNTNWFTYGYCIVWLIVFGLGFANCNLKGFFENFTFESFSKSFVFFMTCAGVSMAIFLFFYLIFAYLPISSFVLSALVFSSLAYIKFYAQVNIPLVYVCLSISALILVLSIVYLGVKAAPRFVLSLREVSSNLFRISPYLFFTFSVVLLFQYFQVSSIVSIFKINTAEPSFKYLYIFLFSWSFFSCSYFIRLFTTSFIYNYLTSRRDFSTSQSYSQSLDNCYNSFNVISFGSTIPSIIAVVRSFLSNTYISLNNSGFIVLRLISYLVLVICYLFSFSTLLFDCINSSILFKLGVNYSYNPQTPAESEEEQDSTNPIDSQESPKLTFKQNVFKYIENFYIFFDVQALLFIGMSVLYFTNYSVLVEQSMIFSFPIFFCLNMLVYSFNSLVTGYLVFDYINKDE